MSNIDALIPNWCEMCEYSEFSENIMKLTLHQQVTIVG